MLKDLLSTLKINHYLKNAIIIIPLFFSMNYANINLLLKCIVMTVSFCLISSAVYILNDLIDIEKDRIHPIKCNRAIASGKVPKKMALCLFITLLIISLYTSFLINMCCMAMILFYLILNILYSTYFKNIAIIDVACISLGFIFRIVAGCFAIDAIPSAFVILMTFFCSMFFTFAKRKMELQLLGQEKCRESIKGFDVPGINQFILVNAILSISFYFTYTMDEVTISRAGTAYLYLTTVPFTLIVFRLLYLINFSSENDDPIIYMKDLTLKILSVFYIFIFVLTYFL